MTVFVQKPFFFPRPFSDDCLGMDSQEVPLITLLLFLVFRSPLHPTSLFFEPQTVYTEASPGVPPCPALPSSGERKKEKGRGTILFPKSLKTWQSVLLVSNT